MKNLVAEIKLELDQMDRIGMGIPETALRYVDDHPNEMAEYWDGGMSISEIADLVCDLTR